MNDPKLLTGTHVVGTNYQCLRRGIGIGLNLPYDAAFAGAYVPVDGRKFYCGNSAVPPVGGGYFDVGSPSKCVQIGVGVGKAQRAGQGAPWGMNFFRYYLPYLIIFLMIGGWIMFLYFAKPKFVIKEDDKGKKVISWKLFVPYCVVFGLVISILIWWFWRRFVRRWI